MAVSFSPLLSLGVACVLLLRDCDGVCNAAVQEASEGVVGHVGVEFSSNRKQLLQSFQVKSRKIVDEYNARSRFERLPILIPSSLFQMTLLRGILHPRTVRSRTLDPI